jgi:hypothetical protein
LANFNEKPKT